MTVDPTTVILLINSSVTVLTLFADKFYDAFTRIKHSDCWGVHVETRTPPNEPSSDHERRETAHRSLEN